MKLRAAFLLFAFVLASIPAQAQGGGPSGNLAAAVANLQARVAKLEGNITSADLVGTYTYTHLFTGLGATPAANISTAIFTGTVTLAANFTGTINLTLVGDTLAQGSPWTLTPDSGSETENVTWSYANGTLTVVGSDGPIPFTVAAGGRLAILAVEGAESGGIQATNLIILTRLH